MFVLIEVCRGRREELCVFEKLSRAVEIAQILCEHSVQNNFRIDYEVVTHFGDIQFKTADKQHYRELLEAVYDTDTLSRQTFNP